MPLDFALEARFPLPILNLALAIERQLSSFQAHIRYLMLTPFALPVSGKFSLLVCFDNEIGSELPVVYLEFRFPVSRCHRHPSNTRALSFEISPVA